jgi:hypothetical protein
MKSASLVKNGSGPPVIRFSARLIRDPKVAKNGCSTLLDVPKAVSQKLSGMTKVEGTINGHPFRAPLDPNPSGGAWLRVNKAMSAGADAHAGDTVKLAILGPEPEPTVPADLKAAFAASVKAKTLWKDLAPDARRIWIRWIEAAKTPETRARRVRRTHEQLSEGKRRPCCVNVYEFMLDRVRR